MLRAKIILKFKNWAQNPVNWNNTDSILNWNQKYSDSIHVDLNHTYLNQIWNHKDYDFINVDTNHTNLNETIVSDLTNIRSIHVLVNISAIEKILTQQVHSPVPASLIFLYGRESDPPSPSLELSAETVTHK